MLSFKSWCCYNSRPTIASSCGLALWRKFWSAVLWSLCLLISKWFWAATLSWCWFYHFQSWAKLFFARSWGPFWNTESISVACHVIYVHLPLDTGCQLQIIMMASSIIYFKQLLFVKMWCGFSVRTVTFLFYWSTRYSAMVFKAVSLFKLRNGVGLCCVLLFHQVLSLCLDNH